MSKNKSTQTSLERDELFNPTLAIAKRFLTNKDDGAVIDEIKPVIFGISGTSLSEDEVKFFTATPIFGFILFNRNIESETQFQTLIKSLKNLYPDRKELFISIDQEGGRVARLKVPITKQKYPSASELSQGYEENKQQTLEKITVNYKELMSELQEFGIACPYAPVADLLHEGAHGVIGDRSFGDNAEKVVDCAMAAMAGIKQASGVPVIKHIPGHGRAEVDSHFELPVVKENVHDLNQTDFEVFRQLSFSKINPNGAQWAMTAHVIFETLDKDKPVTLSKNAIKFIREEIGFQGILITDAIEMMALHQNIEWVKNDQGKMLPKSAEDFYQNLTSLAQSALDAGCNIVLHCTGDLREMEAIAKEI